MSNNEMFPKPSLNQESSQEPDKFEIEEEIDDLLDSVPKGPKHQEISERLDNEELDINDLLAIRDNLKNIAYRRKNPELRFKIYSKNKPESETREVEKIINRDREHLYSALKISVSDMQEFLGNGSVGDAYNVKNYEHLCIKRIHNEEKYNELDLRGQRVQNRIEEEGRFLEELEHFRAKDEEGKEIDVYTPRPLFYIETHEFRGIGMQSLNAKNFARVIEGHDEMPPNFDFNRYFSLLEEYFSQMHKFGVLHKDVAIRNFMIDNETGNPRLIDFGKSRKRSDFYATDRDFEEEAKNEMQALLIAKNDAKEKLNNITKEE